MKVKAIKEKMFSDIFWKNEKRKVGDLKPFPSNPRRANEKEYEDLNKSLERFNLADPLIINTDNTVIGGNFRLKILKERGIEEVDVRVPSRTLTEEEAKELNLRLNKNQGEWDWDLLANFDENLLKEVGFENEELDEIFGLEVDEEFDVEKELNKVLENKERRCKEGDWISEPIDLTYVSSFSTLTASISTPSDSSISIQTRSSADKITWSSWQALSGENIQSAANRYLQVKVIFNASSDRTQTPVLYDLTINYTGDENSPNGKNLQEKKRLK